jgi:hypothetical protein
MHCSGLGGISYLLAQQRCTGSKRDFDIGRA